MTITSSAPKRIAALASLALSAVALVGCAPAAPREVAPTASDVWIKAVPELMNGMGMTGAFMTLENPTDHDITLVGATSTTQGLTDTPLEVHEVVKNDAGEMIMQPAQDGILIPAKGTVTLKPGGFHIMFTSLLQPIPVGSTVGIDLEFSNGSHLDVEAVAREIANAQEKYVPEASATPMEMGK